MRVYLRLRSLQTGRSGDTGVGVLVARFVLQFLLSTFCLMSSSKNEPSTNFGRMVHNIATMHSSMMSLKELLSLVLLVIRSPLS